MRRSLELSLRLLEPFLSQHEGWVIEGCYSDLIRVLMAPGHQLLYLDFAVSVCLERCRQRAWEPHKFVSPQEQEATLPFLLDWVSAYPDREDECSRPAHLRLYQDFPGLRHRFRAPDELEIWRLQWLQEGR